jgi:3-hydroxybutyryl-CoA dehydrogenase
MNDRTEIASPVAVVIGGGTMGAGVAAAFLDRDWTVRMVEPQPQVRAGLADRIQALTGSAPHRFSIVPAIADLDWAGVRIVSESAYEDLAVKRKLFAELAACAPRDVPLTTNSSTFPMRDIAAGLPRTSSMLGMHFLMPANAVPLVEVLDTGTADPAVVDVVIGILRSIGKLPVRLKKEVPGFLVNRMQAALMREALALIDQEVASAEDVDRAVRFGFGFRYAACGPILQKEHSGWDISHKLYQKVFPTLCNDAIPAQVLRQMIAASNLGMKTGTGFVRWNQADMARERERFTRAMRQASDLVRGDGTDSSLDWLE